MAGEAPVVCIARLSEPAAAGNAQPIVSVLQSDGSAGGVRVGGRDFELDGVLGGRETLEEAYTATARGQVAAALAQGAAWTCIAYGPCGGGTEGTVFGVLSDSAECGFAARAARQLFEAAVGSHTNDAECAISLSALYLYEEQISDLLNPLKRNLQVVASRGGGCYVKDLSDVFAADLEDMLDLLHVAASSQSALQSDGYGHILLTFTVRQTWADGTQRGSRISFAQLGGSDMARVGKSETLSRINKGLITLHSIVDELETGMTPEPAAYLRSNLTFLLRDALAGNTKATVIVNVCSGVDGDACQEDAAAQAASALQFGERVRLVQNSPIVDERKDVSQLEAEIRDVSDELLSHRKYINTLEAQLKDAGSMAPSMPSGRTVVPCVQDIDISKAVEGRVDPNVLAVWSAGRLSSLSPDLPVLLDAQASALQQGLDAAAARVSTARQMLASEQELAEDRSKELDALKGTLEAEELLLKWGRSEVERLSAVQTVQSSSFDLLQMPQQPVPQPDADGEDADQNASDELEAQMRATVDQLEQANAKLAAELAEAESREIQLRARLYLRAQRWPDVVLEDDDEVSAGSVSGQVPVSAEQPAPPTQFASPPVEVDMLGFSSIPQGDAGSMFSGMDLLSPATNGGEVGAPEMSDGMPAASVFAGDDSGGGSTKTGDLLQLHHSVELEAQAKLDSELAAAAARAEQEREAAAAAEKEAAKEQKRAAAKKEADARRARLEAKRQAREAAATVAAPPTIDLLGGGGSSASAPPLDPPPQATIAGFDLLGSAAAVPAPAPAPGSFDLLGSMPVATSPWPQQQDQHSSIADPRSQAQQQQAREQQQQQAQAEADARRQRLAAKREAKNAPPAVAPPAFGGMSAPSPAPAPALSGFNLMGQQPPPQQQAPTASTSDVFGGFGASAAASSPAPAPALGGFGGIPAQSLLGMGGAPAQNSAPAAVPAANVDPFAMFGGASPGAAGSSSAPTIGFGSVAGQPQPQVGAFNLLQQPQIVQQPVAPLSSQPAAAGRGAFGGFDFGGMAAPAVTPSPAPTGGRGRGRGRGRSAEGAGGGQFGQQPMQPQSVQQQQSRHYSCSIARGAAGFGINIEEDAMGNAVVGGVTGDSARSEGVKVGSIFMVVGGSAVSGMGRAGVVAALQQPHIASQRTVDFIFDAPAPNAPIAWG